MKVMSE